MHRRKPDASLLRRVRVARGDRFGGDRSGASVPKGCGQLPYAMQVIRQDHDCRDLKRPHGARLAERRTQIIDPLHQQPAATFEKIDRKEAGARPAPRRGDKFDIAATCRTVVPREAGASHPSSQDNTSVTPSRWASAYPTLAP